MATSKGDEWAELWLGNVTDGSMTQRRLSSVERYGGLPALKRVAKARGVHLLLLTDDKGHEVVAASRRPFKVIC